MIPLRLYTKRNGSLHLDELSAATEPKRRPHPETRKRAEHAERNWSCRKRVDDRCRKFIGGTMTRFFALLVLVAVCVSGCSGSTKCARGSATVETAVRTFLVAVQKGDRPTAESQLVYHMELSDQEFEQLRQGLAGVDVGSVSISMSSETPKTYQISVTRQDGTFVGRYFALSTTGQATGCIGMNEGHASAPDPGAIVTPSVASTIAP